jgi:hypothetical protein
MGTFVASYLYLSCQQGRHLLDENHWLGVLLIRGFASRGIFLIAL